MNKQVFEGVNILGFLFAGVGTLTLKPLAEHGATTVRIESSSRPDNLRVSAPFKDGVPGINRSGYYAWINNDRYSIALDLKHPRVSEVTTRLVKWADVIVENFTPGVMDRWGLSYEAVKDIKPDIIMVSLSQQGQTGPHRLMPGYGPQLQGLAGFVHLTGWPDRPPVLVDRSYPDYIAPRFGTIAIIAALDYRRRTGKGQYIDISQYEDCLHFLSPVFLDCAVNKRVQGRDGNRSTRALPHSSYRCKGEDRWCVIAVFTDDEWEVFCKVIGSPSWTKERKFSTALLRKQNETELDRLVEEWTSKHTPEEVMDMMQNAGVPAGVVRTSKDIVDCPQIKHRGYFWRLNHQEIGEQIYPGENFILSKTPYQLKTGAPCLGQHTEYFCKEILGMSEEEYISLLLDGVFE